MGRRRVWLRAAPDDGDDGEAAGCSPMWPVSFSGTYFSLQSKNVGWGRSHGGCPGRPSRHGGRRRGERRHRSPTMSGEWSSGFVTSQSFLRDKRMDNGLGDGKSMVNVRGGPVHRAGKS
jgi:hypothetical protein